MAFGSGTESMLRRLRFAIFLGSVLAIAGLLIAGEGKLFWVPLLGGGVLLGALNRRIGLPSNTSTYDKQIYREVVGIAIAGLAPIAVIVAVATGLIEVEKPEWIYLFGPMITILCGFIVVQAWRFRRAGGGGAEAVAAWKKDGLDAVRSRNSQLQSDKELRAAIERRRPEGTG